MKSSSVPVRAQRARISLQETARRTGRLRIASLGLLVPLLVFACAGDAPLEEETWRVDGLESPASISVDRWGVPHLRAESENDLFFVQGFNAARDDRNDRVTMHTGVVTMDDGLATSTLTGQHRFDNPAVQVRIERVN